MADDVILDATVYVTNVFTSTKDLNKAFSRVQKNSAIKISSLQPALSLLDIHNTRRVEFHDSLLVKLRENLLEKLDSLDERQMEKLLKESFQFIVKDELRDIVVTIMERLETVPEKYLLSISENQHLYEVCPVNIKRQIWQNTQELFGEAVSPLLDKYIEDKDAKMFSQISEDGSTNSFFNYSPKVRRQSDIVQGLVDMIGSSVQLYTILLQFLRTLFIRTAVSHYCTLRADLLMCLHDNKISIICDSDPCHKFAWCLDACIQAGDIDSRKAKELYLFLQSMVSGGNEETIGDLAMLLRDPYAINVICNSIMKTLSTLVQQEKLPRESSDLEFLVRLLHVGLQSLEIVDKQEFHFKQDNETIVKFLPNLMESMVDNHLQLLCTKLGEDPIQQGFTASKFQLKQPLTMHIICFYALHLAKKKDSKQLTELLMAIANCHQKEHTLLPDGFLHQIANHMSSNVKCLQEVNGEILLRNFWVPCSYQDDGMLHLCRLLWGVQAHLEPDLLDTVLKEMKPKQQHNELAYNQYLTLVERIKGPQ